MVKAPPSSERVVHHLDSSTLGYEFSTSSRQKRPKLDKFSQTYHTFRVQMPQTWK